MNKVKYVLDASAVLALLHQEKGFQKIEDFIKEGGLSLSAVNYSEVVGKLSDKGVDLDKFR